MSSPSNHLVHPMVKHTSPLDLSRTLRLTAFQSIPRKAWAVFLAVTLHEATSYLPKAKGGVNGSTLGEDTRVRSAAKSPAKEDLIKEPPTGHLAALECTEKIEIVILYTMALECAGPLAKLGDAIPGRVSVLTT